jgi:HK97 family phage major capsid protein
VEFKANDLTGYALVSRSLMEDAPGLNVWLRTLFAKAVAWYEDYAFLRGTGAGQPVGMLTSGATNKVARNTVNRFELVDAAKVLANLLPHSYINAIWCVSVLLNAGVSAMSELVQLADGSGRVVWVANDRDRAIDRSMGSLFGRPVYPTEKMPALGTTGDVSLIDPSLYVIGDRMQLEIDVSEHPGFLHNQTAWRFTERVDGQPWFGKPITLQDAVSVVSPYVALQ